MFRRNSPASAGKKLRKMSSARCAADHPRPRGEKPERSQHSDAMTGSPPPMRGKDARAVKDARRVGITPAHAGKSTYFCLLSLMQKDHPRPCGEKWCCDMADAHLKGSPPPMRGKGRRAEDHGLSERITPAHAGKRTLTMTTFRTIKDHPRPCGEKLYAGTGYGRNVGSPPPTRGKANSKPVKKPV